MAELDRRQASRIIMSLAESGQPPKIGASYLNVGTEKYLKQLTSEYLDNFLLAYEGDDGSSVCKWIEADYGNGKTQFLRCVQELAWDRNFATAFVELSQDECPLDQPQRVYGAIARSIQVRPNKPSDVEQGKGIDNALQQMLDQMFPGVLSGLANDDLKSHAIEWIQTTLEGTPVECTAYAIAAKKLLLSKLNGDEASAKLCSLFLRGEAVPAAELKSIGIYEKLDKANGFRFLRSMCQLLQRTSLVAGTAILFDEARRSLSLMSNKGQKIACENLLSIINRCNNGEIPGTLFLYAVMPEFFTDFATAYPALQQRCGPQTRFALNVLQIKEIELLQEIGRRILKIYQIAYPDAEIDYEIAEKNLCVIANQALSDTMGTGTRRLLVKTWVHTLNHLRNEGFRNLSPEEAKQFVEGAAREIGNMDAAVVNSTGE